MIWPNSLQKSNKRRLRFVQSLAVALMNRKMSLTKKRCERQTPILKLIGWILLLQTASVSLIDNLSKQRIKKYGERGSPCRIPQLGTTSGRGDPFHRIWKRVEVIIFMMKAMRLEGTWKYSRISWIKGHSRRSYAFSRSNLSATYPVRPQWEIRVRITSWTMIILSLIRQTGTNPAWQGLMASPMKGLSRCTIIRDSSL